MVSLVFSTEDMTDKELEDTVLNLEHIDYVVIKMIVSRMNEHDSI